MEYESQSAGDLRLHLLKDKGADLSSLTILETIECAHGRWGNIRASIIGASHFLEIDGPLGYVAEVFACVPEIPGAHASPIDVFKEEKRYRHEEVVSEYVHRHTSVLYQGAGEELIEVYRDALLHEASHKQVVFPRGECDAYTPETVIGLTVGDCRIILRTLHVYPNEHSCVYTCTIVDSIKGG